MTSLILRTATRYILPIVVLFAVFLLVRGHDEPGGGFIGGLMAAGALALHAMVYGPAETRILLRIDPRTLTALGLLAAALSGMVRLTEGLPFLTSRWEDLHLPGVGEVHVSTPLVFDIGVFAVVVGVTLMILLPLAETEEVEQ